MEEEEACAGGGEEGGYVGRGWGVGVDVFEVPLPEISNYPDISRCPEKGRIHIPIHPLRLLENIQAGMDNELVHVLRRVRETEPGNAIAAAFGGAKGDVEEGGVGRREDGEVVGHFSLAVEGIVIQKCILVLVRWWV